MKRQLEVKDIDVGGLSLMLWIILVISMAAMIFEPWSAEVERAEDYRKSLLDNLSARERDSLYLKRLSRAINPHGLAPATFTLAVGFLAVMRAQRVAAALTVAAIERQPEQTAAAIRAAAQAAKQPKQPPPVPKPAPAAPFGSQTDSPEEWDMQIGGKR
jgi:FtsZ-interacting cell division protein ZipA